MRREWTRVGRRDDMMFCVVDERLLRDRIGTPEDEYDTFPIL